MKFTLGQIVHHKTNTTQELVITEFRDDAVAKCEWLCSGGVPHERWIETSMLIDVMDYGRVIRQMNDALEAYRDNRNGETAKTVQDGIEYMKKAYSGMKVLSGAIQTFESLREMKKRKMPSFQDFMREMSEQN